MDPFFVEYAEENYRQGRKVVAVPDPLPASARRLSAVSVREDDGRIELLLFGALSRRKGLLSLLDAARLFDRSIAGQCRLVLAGRLDADVDQSVRRRIEVLRVEQPSLEIELLEGGVRGGGHHSTTDTTSSSMSRP